uniref:Uncharacterized protein n=1 Tax=Noctiluca scintillans TaxID=2966 RepID=A0A7S1AYQ7_NOCSC|mmetsp:Transcript_6479/g.18115  ORF Transcript_6479/g.18115 Transcript_6479/m.18115 type:complete len:708 (+) Transcript_6479:114-2237(+)
MTGTATPVLDFDPQEVDAEAVAQTRRLLSRVLASHGPPGLARALHVSAPQASQLKHRVACVTCRSRLDGLAAELAIATAASAATVNTSAGAEQGDGRHELIDAGEGATSPEPTLAERRPPPAQTLHEGGTWPSAATDASIGPPPPDGPTPLMAWLAADGGRGLAPAPHALRDLGALAAFLAAYGFASSPIAGETEADEPGRRGGRTGIIRCPYHSTRTAVRASAMASMLPGSAATSHERARVLALLRSATSEAEWRTLGTVDMDDVMCDLFTWLGDRGLCSSCIDVVTGALLEVRRTVAAAANTCTCQCCKGKCSADRATTPSLGLVVAGDPPEFVRVAGRLKGICGVYRRELLPFNGRPVYKKERAEAYLLYTNLKDWMISGKADAGGARCEGWAYVTDVAETPDEICGVWRVSGPREWEEDRSLCVTAFRSLPEDLRAGIGYDDGSAIARRLTADNRGFLVVPLNEPEVLEEVLWSSEEPMPGGPRPGGCTHILTAEAAQRELRCWLRWFLRERLEVQRWRVLRQAQVSASLCRLFACGALKQLEQAADTPAGGKKGRSKKGKLPFPDGDACDDFTSAAEVECGDSANSSGGKCARGAEDPDDGASSAAAPLSPTAVACSSGDSEESASTRASSEDPPDAHRARLATKARRLMEQMGWRPENSSTVLDGAEVAAWREQHPRYRQVIREERQKLRTQFQQWARAVP